MGGHTYNTPPIKLELISPTINEYVCELNRIFPIVNFNFIPLGSTGKKAESGDIDLGISETILCPIKLNINPTKLYKRIEKLNNRARTSNESQLRLKAILIEMSDVINSSSKLININLKKITTGTIFSSFPQYNNDSIVQIDWMVGNLNWLQFAYFSDVYDDHNIKGLHRTQLLVALFNIIGLIFVHTLGIKNQSNNIVTTSPQTALTLVNDSLNLKLNVSMASNFFTLYDHLERNLDTFHFNLLIAEYVKILKLTPNCIVPKCVG